MKTINLTVAQIIDLAKFAGLSLGEHNPCDEDELSTEITIFSNPRGVIIASENERPKLAKTVAFFAEYPEEGGVPLGDIEDMVK